MSQPPVADRLDELLSTVPIVRPGCPDPRGPLAYRARIAYLATVARHMSRAEQLRRWVRLDRAQGRFITRTERN